MSHRTCRKDGSTLPKFYDYLKLDELGIEIHLAKDGQIISPESKSQAKLMHEISLVMAKHYIDNLRDEVRKGMREKASQGIYPSRPPLGYANDVAEGSIVVHEQNSPIVKDLSPYMRQAIIPWRRFERRFLSATVRSTRKDTCTNS